MSRGGVDKELQQYRNLMEVPSTFEDGFTWTSLAGALFVALLMVPGAMYMHLVAGHAIGPAAQWVTVILFIEVSRRAHKQLKRAEIFVLFYMAAAVMSQMQADSGLLVNQFFAQSKAATGMGIAEQLPEWFAPNDPEILAERNFFNPAWYPAIGLMVFTMFLNRINPTILAYGLFRLASDIERLPFPMAYIGAQGVTALAEQQYEESQRGQADQAGNWRWRVFSIGGVLGLGFGCIYTALPVISTALFGETMTILPIPFVDWTQKTSGLLPAVPTGMTLNLAQLVIGMVMPFFAVVGTFAGYLIQVIANPFLYKFGYLTSWDPTDDTILTIFKNYVDFYFSFGLGIMAALAIIGIWQVSKGLKAHRKARRQLEARGELDPDLYAGGVPPGRTTFRHRVAEDAQREGAAASDPRGRERH